ncbi:OmpA family protein [Pseudorhodoferax sp. Leaf267]|uniref:OmpA family protein n=1 Tax=Pseudorhodoferax sp. Leaf267 TaxID=1736316 RepID=UPI0006F7BB5B|nr:OmpA family protein [Pseudorhodoferax sp. Leaf267]KQP12837.1 cell envelope biogenesis protein OmpA [Pseudorhodoferax sp. Leaf267]
MTIPSALAAPRTLALRRRLIAAVLVAAPLAAAAQAVPARGTGAAMPAPRPGMVVVAGTVPDEGARQAILARVRELYGADRVVDQLGVANLVAPPGWAEKVQRMLSPELKQVRHGQIAIQGNLVEIKGEVANEAVRQQLVSTLSTQINNPTYTVRNGLRVAAAGQEQVDSALASRTIEFEAGSSDLTPSGQLALDQLVPVLSQLSGRSFEIIGHTDAQGARSTNVALSAARADRVKTYLVGKGMQASAFSTSGVGPDRPVASNETPEGRARNRRIELRVGQ